MADVVETNTGYPSESFISALGNDTHNENTRISWKYGCSRGVPATPWFFINGIFIDAQYDWTVDDWIMVLDPLLDPKKRSSFGHRNEHISAPSFGRPNEHISAPSFGRPNERVLPLSNCPSGKIECDYLPGKYQCCLTGERCVPNVGCRC